MAEVLGYAKVTHFLHTKSKFDVADAMRDAVFDGKYYEVKIEDKHDCVIKIKGRSYWFDKRDVEIIKESDFHLATCVWRDEPATIYRSNECKNGNWYLLQNHTDGAIPDEDKWHQYGIYSYYFSTGLDYLLKEVSQVQFKNKLPIQTPATQFKIIPKEKEVKMLEHLSNDQKIQYSKLTTAQKAQYKNGLIDLNGNLTSEGKDFVMAYIIDENKSEALKSINDTLDKVNEEIASKN